MSGCYSSTSGSCARRRPSATQCDPALLNEMFRSAHSLKGLSAMLGLTDINNLTHKIENVFDAARKNELAVNGDVTELVFMGLDQLTAPDRPIERAGGRTGRLHRRGRFHPPLAADGRRGTETVVASRCREGHGPEQGDGEKGSKGDGEMRRWRRGEVSPSPPLPVSPLIPSRRSPGGRAGRRRDSAEIPVDLHRRERGVAGWTDRHLVVAG